MAFYLRELNEGLGQHRHLPFVLARNPCYFDELHVGKLGSKIGVQLTDMLEEAVSLLRGENDAAGIVLQVIQSRHDVLVHGNKIQLEQVVTNL